MRSDTPGNPFLVPFILVTCLFFTWGFAISMLDVLNKHFQETLQVTRAQSGLIQFAVYGAYFLMAIPAGRFMQRYSYQKGILLGLGLYALGAFLFYPATQVATFTFFLIALFVIGCGLAIIETAANPYVTVLGDPEGATRRLNLAQSFNGLGVVLGPLVGGLVLFSSTNEESVSLMSIQMPYLIIGFFVLLLFVLFSFFKLPDINVTKTHDGSTEIKEPVPSLFKQRHFVYAVITLFFYVGAQAGVWGFFINYAVEEIPGMTNQQGAFYLTFAMVVYMVGRFGGTWAMRYVSPRSLLIIFGVVAVLSMVAVIFRLGTFSLYALIISCFCMSIMFPTIFSMGLSNLGSETKRGASYMIMSIVGGAIVPPLMGAIADASMISHAFIMPMCCFCVVCWYGWGGIKLKIIVRN